MPSLLALNASYTDHIDPVNSFPLTPIYVDYLRTAWRLDASNDRPPESAAVKGLGLAFGVLLAACTDLCWAIETDDGDPFLTLAREAVEPVLVSVPPFSYVRKRQDVENAKRSSSISLSKCLRNSLDFAGHRTGCSMPTPNPSSKWPRLRRGHLSQTLGVADAREGTSACRE